MQILAQGIVTVVAPYLHLGYVAAQSNPIFSWSDPMPTGFSVAPVPVFLGISMGAALLWMVRRYLQQRERPRGLAIPSLICLVCLALASAGITGPGPPSGKVVTTARAKRILTVVRIFVGESVNERPVESLRDPRLRLPRYTRPPEGIAPPSPDPLEGQVHTDYWGREFELKFRIVTGRWTYSGAETFEVKSCEYWLVSAGPDGQFGTADDIVIEPLKK